ncbi:MAG: hypothetical protein Q9219_000464 [cf. Caloplaca sp. 3 TL-2023]
MHGLASLHSMTDKKAIDKETFFQELYDLDEPDHSSGDVDSLLATIRASLYEMPATKKRKRSKSIELLAENRQIFRDLRFCKPALDAVSRGATDPLPVFLPDDDVAPARKLRIRRCRERGATWVKQWEDGITHIIAEKRLTYSDIIKYLKIPSIPSSMVLVNELYPSECIQFQMLVDPDQYMYYVQGHKEQVAPAQDGTSKTSSPKSLPLKLAKQATRQQSQVTVQTEPSGPDPSNQPSVEDVINQQPKMAVDDPPKPQDRVSDALDKAIEETIAVKDLPLDDEDDQSPRSSMVMQSLTDDEDSEKEVETKKVPQIPPEKSWQAKFSCMDKHTGTDNQENPNARTIEILQKMSDYYDRTKDHWRTLAYRKAITALKKQRQKITSKEAALGIPSIGDRLASKIEEIVLSNRLRRLENTTFDERDTALQLFLSIYGVGFAQASQWVEQGHRTLRDLLSDKVSLTRNQRIGIDHLEDFSARIPRKEVEQHGKIVRDAIQQVDPTLELTIGGSYRRGAADSGDVDFIVTKPGAGIEVLRTIVLDTLIPRLFASNYLKASLAAASTSRPSSSLSSGSKWHGCACLPGPSSFANPNNKRKPWRRVDFLLVPHEEMGAALIYFTGNDIFNRSIRLLASKKGYRLNQHGLWRDVMRGKGRERMTQGNLVEGRSERRIFEILEVPWRPPNHRIC